MKYLRTFLLALQVQLQYRANIVGWLIVGIIPTIVLVLIWFAILGNRSQIGGFTKGDFIIYYIFQTIGWYIVGGAFARPLGTRIKNGDVTKTLLKPYNLVLERALSEQAWKVISLFFAIPTLFIVLILFHQDIHLTFSFPEIILLVVSLVFGGIIFGLFEAIAGCSAFWIAEVWPVADMFDILLGLFGGRLVPIALMPTVLKHICQVLPFQYVFYLPVAILLHKTDQPVRDVMIQGLFVIVMFLIYQLIWQAGVKKYEAVGG